ncbi:basic proline-rich protein-like [Tympanuchus pallidicinctus]|uniref:basic proline-rich protein-like n=1 Tax=Tympanuchus pallidicinctus TaxID=109042 RepID=UPI0022870F43|nr:basic proline-rich protein-like [Tympanuchus pallidicinctus]
MNESGPESPVPRRPPRDLERTAGAAAGAKQRRAGGAEQRAERRRPPGPRSPRRPASHLQAAPAAPFRGRPSFSSPSRRPARTLAPPPALRAPRRAPERRASAPATASRGAARRCGKRVRGCAESRSAAGGGRRAFPMIGAPLRTAPPSDPRPSPAAPRLLRRVGFQSLWRPLRRRSEESFRGRRLLERQSYRAGPAAGPSHSAGPEGAALGGRRRLCAAPRERPPAEGLSGAARPPPPPPTPRPERRSPRRWLRRRFSELPCDPYPPAATRRRSELTARPGPSEPPAGLALREETRASPCLGELRAATRGRRALGLYLRSGRKAVFLR